MKHLGDITKISGYTALPVDVITGGSPCQDLSVAGKRAGLAGERSGLFMEQIRIIKEMRENDRRTGRSDELVRPRYMVWENVPGAFSSNGGGDFRAVLEETAKIADPDAVIPRPPAGKWHKDADSPRYKALGNSIALPFWCWMAERMVQYLGDTPTMASLFDGIGGFPFAFSRMGCAPVWASEIEEFPIAVTKIRFPE